MKFLTHRCCSPVGINLWGGYFNAQHRVQKLNTSENDSQFEERISFTLMQIQYRLLGQDTPEKPKADLSKID